MLTSLFSLVSKSDTDVLFAAPLLGAIPPVVGPWWCR